MAKLKKLKKPGSIAYFRCPTCGERNEAGVEKCVGCGLVFRAGEKKEEDQAPKPPQPIQAQDKQVHQEELRQKSEEEQVKKEEVPPIKESEPPQSKKVPIGDVNGVKRHDLELIPTMPEVKVAVEKQIEDLDEKVKLPESSAGVNGFESIDIPLEPSHISPEEVVSECPICGAYSKGIVRTCPECGSVFEPINGINGIKGENGKLIEKTELTAEELVDEMYTDLTKDKTKKEEIKKDVLPITTKITEEKKSQPTGKPIMEKIETKEELEHVDLTSIKNELKNEFSVELDKEFEKAVSKLENEVKQLGTKLETTVLEKLASELTKKMEISLTGKFEKFITEKIKELPKSEGKVTFETKDAIKSELLKELKTELLPGIPAKVNEDAIIEKIESKLSSKLDSKLGIFENRIEAKLGEEIEGRLGKLMPKDRVDAQAVLKDTVIKDIQDITKKVEDLQAKVERSLNEYSQTQTKRFTEELEKMKAQYQVELANLTVKGVSTADIDAWRKFYEERAREVEKEYKEKFEQMQKEYQGRLNTAEREAQLEIESTEVELKREFEEKLKEKEEELRSNFERERREMLQKFDQTLKAELRKKEDELLMRSFIEAKKKEDELQAKLSALDMDIQKQVRTKVEEEIPKIRENTKRELEAIYTAREKEILANAENRIKVLENEIRQKIESENRLRLETVRLASLAVSKGLPNYPFTAIVGQDKMKRALILNAINPTIGGVLLWGPKGNGKTTAILGLNVLLGKLSGKGGEALTVEEIQKRFIVGEIMTYQLQGEYIIDTLSNSVALSISNGERPIVVREAIHEEESSMKMFNRIPFKIEVPPIQNIEQRIEVMRRVLDFKKSPESFQKKFENDEKKLLSRITKAREILPNVNLSTQMMENIARLCLFNNQGQKADIFIGELAKTNAAFEERDKVILDDVREVSDMVFTDKFDSVFNIDNLKPEKKFSLTPVPRVKGEQEVKFYIKAE